MSKQETTDLGHCIIGLLHRGPMTGYEVRKLFETTSLRIYSSSPGSIYPALKRLEKLGWLKTVVAPKPGTGTMRDAYSPSEAGIAAFKQWLDFPDVDVDETDKLAPSIMLRFAFLEDHCSTDKILDFLARFQDLLKASHASLNSQLDNMPEQAPKSARLALEAGVMGAQSQLDWAGHAIKTYSKTARVK